MNSSLSSTDKYLNLNGDVKLKGLKASTTNTDTIFRYAYVRADATTISRPKILSFDSNMQQTPKVKLANSSDLNVLGVCITSLISGENKIITKGIITDLNLSPSEVGKKIYCDNLGNLTYDVGAVCVGILIEANKVFINVPRSYDELTIAQKPSPDDPNKTASQILRQISYEYDLVDIMYPGKVFIAGNGKVLVSKDGYSEDNGLNWLPFITAPPPLSNSSKCIYSHEKGIFVIATLQPSEGIAYSTDGKNWDVVGTPDGSWSNLAYGNGFFVCIATVGNGGLVLVSDNGIDWNQKVVADDEFIARGVVFGNGTFLIVGTTLDSLTAKHFYSTDNGQTWQDAPPPPLVIYNRIIFGNGIFVALSLSPTSQLTTSTDGLSWTTPVATPLINVGNYFDVLGFALNKFYLGVQNLNILTPTPNNLFSSSDGISWLAVETTYNNKISYVDVNVANDILFGIGFEGFSRTILL